MVERLGCRAKSATGGAEALALVTNEVPDLILLDIVMPGMTGPEFLKELRQTHSRIPVVIVTGYPEGELTAEAMKFGPLLLLSKPVEAAEMEKMVRLVAGDRLARNLRIEPDATVPQDVGRERTA